MLPLKNKKLIAALTLGIAIIGMQTFAQQKEHEEIKPTNLKVLPKKMSGEEVVRIMRVYCKSLGVRCGYCHAAVKGAVGDKPNLDFASDEKPEKEIARRMMKMTEAINEKYIAKMGDHQMQQVSCVTCHMGSAHPVANVDSLKRKDAKG